MDQELLEKYFAGDISSDEKDEIIRWVNADENNKTELLALRQLHDVTIWQQHKEEIVKTKKRYMKWPAIQRIASVAAVFILLSGGIYILRLRQQIPETVMQTMHVP
jgi:hypothetical protein